MHPYSVADVDQFVARWWGNNVFVTPYSYSVQFAALAQNGNTVAAVNLSANADFLLLGLAFRASIGGVQTNATQAVPFIRLQVTDTGSGESLFQQATDLVAVASNNERARGLVYPRIFRGKTALSISLTNFAPAAETYSGEVILEGVQVRPLG